jgi:hypothetical protein
MDAECAFCGRDQAASLCVFCDDCQSEHRVCRACADSTAEEAAILGLDLIRQVA